MANRSHLQLISSRSPDSSERRKLSPAPTLKSHEYLTISELSTRLSVLYALSPSDVVAIVAVVNDRIEKAREKRHAARWGALSPHYEPFRDGDIE